MDGSALFVSASVVVLIVVLVGLVRFLSDRRRKDEM